MSYFKLAPAIQNPSIYSGVVQNKEAPSDFSQNVKTATATPPVHQIFKDKYLEAPPRNNPWKTPYLVQVGKGEAELNKMEHSNCLVGFNPMQNVPSVFCTENNENWVRGNTFATLPLGEEKLSYLNVPGVKKETNPMFIQDRIFYQFPDVNNYYPQKKSQINGKSYFVYPYSPEIIVNKYGKDGNISKYLIKENDKENFISGNGYYMRENMYKKITLIIIFIVILFCSVFSVIKYPN